jgi:hypothetical protein
MNDMKKPVAVPEIGIEPDAALIAICAELIRLCDRNVQLERLLDEEYSDGRDIPPNGPIMAEINGNMEQISTIPATTLEGLKARAKAIDTYAPDLKSADLGGPAKKMVAAMLRDLTGEVQV